MKDPLHPIEASPLHARRELVFLIVSGLFLGSLTMLNVLGLTRFIDLSFTVMGVDVPMPLAVGVLHIAARPTPVASSKLPMRRASRDAERITADPCAAQRLRSAPTARQRTPQQPPSALQTLPHTL